MYKQVIVMRTDLNMRKGKMVAQGAHASMLALFNSGKMRSKGILVPYDFSNDEEVEWFEDRFTKICVGIDNLDDLIKIHERAFTLGYRCAIIEDSGRTEFNGNPTVTCVAIGPEKAELIDEITGDLKLL